MSTIKAPNFYLSWRTTYLVAREARDLRVSLRRAGRALAQDLLSNLPGLNLDHTAFELHNGRRPAGQCLRFFQVGHGEPAPPGIGSVSRRPCRGPALFQRRGRRRPRPDRRMARPGDPRHSPGHRCGQPISLVTRQL